MPALGDHVNVWNTCLLIIRSSGYLIRLEADDSGADLDECFWVAEKNGYDLWASNPIELLGLVKIHEFQSPAGAPQSYWWRLEGDDIVEELIGKRWPD